MNDGKWKWTKPSTLVFVIIVYSVLIDQEGIEKTASYILTFTLLFIWYKYLTRYRG